MASVSVFCFFAVYVVSFLNVSGYGQNTWPLKLSNPLIVFQEYLTPSAFQHWASINAIPCHYWIIDWFMSLFFYFSDLRSVWFYNGQTWATYKKKVPYGDRSNGLMHPRGLSSFLRHHNCSNVFFCAINICLKETNFKREIEQNILHRRLEITIAQYWFTLGVRYGCLSIFSQVLIFFFYFLLPK